MKDKSVPDARRASVILRDWRSVRNVVLKSVMTCLQSTGVGSFVSLPRQSLHAVVFVRDDLVHGHVMDTDLYCDLALGQKSIVPQAQHTGALGIGHTRAAGHFDAIRVTTGVGNWCRWFNDTSLWFFASW